MAHSDPSLTRRDLLASLAVLAMPGTIAGALGASSQQGPKREVVIVEKAAEALVEISQIPARGIPMDLLRKAHGIVIVPDLVKAGFVIAGRVGRGVLMARDENGLWTNPVFLGMAGGSIGPQVGISDTDVVLVFRTRKSVDDFLSHNKVTLGAAAAVAAGPLGRQAEADTDLKMRAEILSYSRRPGVVRRGGDRGGLAARPASVERRLLQRAKPARGRHPRGSRRRRSSARHPALGRTASEDARHPLRRAEARAARCSLAGRAAAKVRRISTADFGDEFRWQ